MNSQNQLYLQLLQCTKQWNFFITSVDFYLKKKSTTLLKTPIQTETDYSSRNRL